MSLGGFNSPSCLTNSLVVEWGLERVGVAAAPPHREDVCGVRAHDMGRVEAETQLVLHIKMLDVFYLTMIELMSKK